jgi:hypothetical protein
MTFGNIFGNPDIPAYISPEGPVWMWRKGQKVRFLTADGSQIGPEHANVAPATASAAHAGWIDPTNVALSLAFRDEIRGTRKESKLCP